MRLPAKPETEARGSDWGCLPGMKLFIKLAMENSVPVVSRKSTYRNVNSASHHCGVP